MGHTTTKTTQNIHLAASELCRAVRETTQGYKSPKWRLLTFRLKMRG